MLTSACKKEHLFLRRRPSGYLFHVLTESLFNSEYCEIFKSASWRTSANGCFWKCVHETEKN